VTPRPTPEELDLVLAGGGVLGIGHVGVLSVLEDRGYVFKRMAGTSAGSIVAALLAADMPVGRMRELVGELDYLSFRDRSARDRIPLIGPLASVLFENGFYEGEHLHKWLRDELAKLGVHTFRDLRIDDPESSLEKDQRYRLVVMAADLTTGELVRLPWDYPRYGLDPDKESVADAVRASMSIPYFFEPKKLTDVDEKEHLLVDGGVLSNYPLEVFDRTDGKRPRWPTFGVTLLPPLPAGSTQIFPQLRGLRRVGALGFLESLVTTLVVGRDQGYLNQPWVKARSMQVDNLGINPVDFGITKDEAARLFQSGHDRAEAFLGTWNWDKYLSTYRL
jgi:NTE family protein